MSTKQKSQSILSDLKSLVETLTDRDAKLKKEFRLFQDFFKNFPIPVSMWSTTSDLRISSLKNNGFFCIDSECLADCFECEPTREKIVKMNTIASAGESVSDTVKKDSKMYYVVIVPRNEENGSVTGTSGMAWDVSSNSFILNTLMEIKSSTEDKSGTLKEINKKASQAINKSRLFALMKKKEEIDV